VQAITVVSAVLVIVVNLAVDLSYSFLDPRVTYEEKAVDARPLTEVVPLARPAPSTRGIRLGATLLTGLVLLGLVILVAIAAPLLTPYDPLEQRFTEAFLPPFSAGHILGTDNFGRDIWSRIVYSTRLDLQIGLLSVLFPFLFGGLIGITTGYLGGKLDTLLMRVVDVLMAFPFLILVIAIMSILGPGLTNLYIAVGAVGWIPYARITVAKRSRRATWSTCWPPDDRLLFRAHHEPPHPAERDRARADLRLHGHGAGDPHGATLSFLGLARSRRRPNGAR